MKLSTMILAGALATTAPLAALAQTTADPQPTMQPKSNPNIASAPDQAKDHAMSRRHVEELQAALQRNGAKDLAVDGLWGPKTAQALRDYQKQHGLPVTGQFDHATAQKLTLPHWNA